MSKGGNYSRSYCFDTGPQGDCHEAYYMIFHLRKCHTHEVRLYYASTLQEL